MVSIIKDGSNKNTFELIFNVRISTIHLQYSHKDIQNKKSKFLFSLTNDSIHSLSLSLLIEIYRTLVSKDPLTNQNLFPGYMKSFRARNNFT